MHSTVWRELIGRIPQKQHNRLGVVTNVGLEISIQDVIKVQEEYLVVRGRLSGTSDTGRIFFIPFDQICYIGILKLVPENEIAEMFGLPKSKTGTRPVAAESLPEAEPQSQVDDEESVEQDLETDPNEDDDESELKPRTAATPVKFPNRAELLERIKNRSQKGHPLRSPPK